MKQLAMNEESASNFYIISLLLFISARFIFTGLMKYFSPGKLLVFAAIMASICTGLTISLTGYAGVISLVMTSFFMSLMFPTIYGLTITGLKEDTKIGGSGHIMAIIGGAVITAAQGTVSDNAGINMSYIIPLICFIVVVMYGIYIEKKTYKNIIV